MNLTTLQIDFDPYYLSLNDHRFEYLFGYNVKKCYLEISICFFFLFVEALSYLLWCNVTTLNFNDRQSSATFDDSKLSGLFLRTINLPFIQRNTWLGGSTEIYYIYYMYRDSSHRCTGITFLLSQFVYLFHFISRGQNWRLNNCMKCMDTI